MRKYLFAALLYLLPFSAMAQQQQQQTPSPIPQALEALGEVPHGAGMLAAGATFMLFVNPVTKTFSIVAIGSGGSQVVVEGKNWEDIVPPSHNAPQSPTTEAKSE